MRIGTQGSIQMLKTNLARPAQELSTLYGQLTSGKRLQKPSDDPLATGRVVRSQAALSELSGRKFVLQMGEQFMGGADSALGEIATDLNNCKDLALQGAEPTLGTAERAAIAQQIRSLCSSLVSAGNTEVQGQYLFAGTQTDTVPFEAADDANLPVLYHGNHQQLTYALTQYEQAPAAFTGSEVFNYTQADGTRPVAGVDQDVFSLLTNLAVAIESGDTGSVATYSNQLDKCYSHVVGLRGQAGVVTQRYERAMNVVEDTEVRVKALLSADQDVDYATAVTELERQQTVYQAALSMTSKLLQMPDLFDLPWE